MTAARSEDGACPRCFCLRGTLEGEALRFTLWEGELSVGSLEGSDIHLQTAAVSRRHALLEVRDGRVLVRDAGSKNGTWLNGVRVTEAEIRAGDEVGFGPAAFRLAEVDPDDALLAIDHGRRCSEPPPIAQSELETGTQASRSTGQPVRWMTLLDRIGACLLPPAEPDLPGALEQLATTLGAEGAVLAEAGESGAAVALAAAGRTVPRIESAELRAEIAGVRRRASADGCVSSSFSLDKPEPLTGAVAAAPGAPPTLLVLAGDLAHRGAASELLQLVLRMVLAARSQPVAFEAARAQYGPPPPLVLPDGCVPASAAAMRLVYDQLRQVLLGDLPVLITGETGAGKEVVARILHGSSERCSRPLVAVNCAAIPSELLEAELFGIERGVATGVDARVGKFQLAEGGTLFLDEIGDMSAELQAKLLRTLQQMEVHPLGAKAPVPVDVRLVSATNTNLKERIAERKFRRDLYFRVAGFTVRIPPLRERREDIPALVEHFLRRYAGAIGKPVRGVTVKALQLLAEAPWPGNVRELEHEVRRLVYLCPPNQAIDSSMLSEAVLSPTLDVSLAALEPGVTLDLATHTEELERKLITVALARTRGNISRAARRLGLSRNGLKNRMARYGIE